jgi:hypothetical protein
LTYPCFFFHAIDVERNVKQAANDVDAFLSTGHYVHDYDAQVVKAEAPKATRRDFIAHFSSASPMVPSAVFFGRRSTEKESFFRQSGRTERSSLAPRGLGSLWISLFTVSV